MRLSSTAPSGETAFWLAHDHPERPFDRGVFVCECAACGLAVRAAAQANPEFRLVVRGGITRRVVRLDEAALAATSSEGLAGLVLPGDSLRDMSSAADNAEIAAERKDPRAVSRAPARRDGTAAAGGCPPEAQAAEPLSAVRTPPVDGLGL